MVFIRLCVVESLELNLLKGLHKIVGVSALADPSPKCFVFFSDEREDHVTEQKGLLQGTKLPFSS